MGINRNKFKSTSVDNLKKQEEEIGSKIGRKGKTDYLEIEKGTNKFRLFPGHPDTKSFIYPRTVFWLYKRGKDDDTGEEKIYKKPVFNSRIHGNTEKDIVEEYLKFTSEKLEDEIKDEAHLDEKLKELTHWKDGIKAKTEWICYAKKIKGGGSEQFGLLSITNGIKDKLNEIAIVEDADQPIETDPFTDPDDGKAIIITKNPDAKDYKDYYKVTLEFRGNYALEDEELERLLESDSLEKMYVDSYRRRDFELALEGLEIFDNKKGFGTFQDPEWIDIVEELDATYPEDDDADNNSEPLGAEDDGFVDIEAMSRNQLKKYIKSEGLPVIVKKGMSDDEIRQEIYDALDDDSDVDEEELEEEIQEEIEDEPEVEEEDEDDEEADNVSDKIAQMRARAKKKKG